MDRSTLAKLSKVVLAGILTPEALSSISGPYGMLVSNLLKNASMDAVIESLAGSLPDSSLVEVESILNESGYYPA